MTSDITLTSALQNNLQSLQKSKGAANVRPADNVGDIDSTGACAPSAIAQAAQDFCTQSLSNRASDLTQLLDKLSQSIKTLEKANQGVEAITEIIKEAESLALMAQKSDDPAQHDHKMDGIEERMNAAVKEAETAGINLLTGDTLKTAFGDNERNAVITEGVDLSPEGLGFEEIYFASGTSITESIEIIRSAMDDAQSLRLTVVGDLKDIQTRQDFALQTIGTLEAGKSEINVTALSEEGANLLALQTKMTLIATSLSLASQTQEDVLRLF